MMLDGFLGRAMQLRVLTLRLLGHFTDERLKLEQLHCACESFSPPAPYFSISAAGAIPLTLATKKKATTHAAALSLQPVWISD
jgi:hypothetical protein